MDSAPWIWFILHDRYFLFLARLFTGHPSVRLSVCLSVYTRKLCDMRVFVKFHVNDAYYYLYVIT